jgi:hypothetical protein
MERNYLITIPIDEAVLSVKSKRASYPCIVDTVSPAGLCLVCLVLDELALFVCSKQRQTDRLAG